MVIKWTKADVIKRFQEAMTSPQPQTAGTDLLTRFKELAQKRKAGAGAESPPATE